ncbi:MAG: DUF6406 domain-containing protein [Actinocatenispora sp.]
MAESTRLRHGRRYSLTAGRVAVVFLSDPSVDGRPVRAELSVAPWGSASQRVTVGLGDRFMIGAETWVLDNVHNIGTYEYVVSISRVSDEPTG